jgi:hypothetical protein
MSNNKRLYYACEDIGIAPDGTNSFVRVHGVQSAGSNVSFNLDAISELGQSALYENKEVLPDVQFTAQKVLDGFPLMYHLATQSSTTGTLQGRSRAKCLISVITFDDTLDSASGVPQSECLMSGMFPSSISYTFGVDGNFTEDMTFVGNNRLWRNTENGAGGPAPLFSGTSLNTDVPYAITGSGGVNRRWNFLFDVNSIQPLDVNGQVNYNGATILPPDIEGISSSGVNFRNSDGTFKTSVQSITASVDLNRQDIFELGNRNPYFKFVQFPVQVTCAITVNAKKWDNVSATYYGVADGAGNNLFNRSIKIKTLEGTFIDLGVKNKLASADFTLGDTGGQNGTVTYNYTTYNDFTVKHPQDPNVSLR